MIDGQGELLLFQLLGGKKKDESSTRFRTGDFEYQSMRVRTNSGNEYERSHHRGIIDMRGSWTSCRLALLPNYRGTSVCQIYVRRDLIGIAAI
ncbi:unnamed protein product, partial [Ixodes pacificus]